LTGAKNRKVNALTALKDFANSKSERGSDAKFTDPQIDLIKKVSVAQYAVDHAKPGEKIEKQAALDKLEKDTDPNYTAVKTLVTSTKLKAELYAKVSELNTANDEWAAIVEIVTPAQSVNP